MTETQTRAAPPDDGGNQGSFTVPQDELEQLDDSKLRNTTQDAAAPHASDHGVTFTIGLLVLGSLGVMGYFCALAP